MKALKLLKILRDDYVHGELDSDVIEAIKELEDLQNRSCKNCKFGMEYHFDDEIECFKIEADTQGIYFSNDFCCNKWEQKWKI